MSLSIKSITNWIQILSAFLALVVVSFAAIWLGITYTNNTSGQLSVIPKIDVDFNKLAQNRDISMAHNQFERTQSQPFWKNKSVTVKDENLKLNSIGLEMILSGGGKKLCVTNGELMKEGDNGGFFKIEEITDSGVWYTSNNKGFYLEVGSKILLDNDGNMQNNQSAQVQ